MQDEIMQLLLPCGFLSLEHNMHHVTVLNHLFCTDWKHKLMSCTVASWPQAHKVMLSMNLWRFISKTSYIQHLDATDIFTGPLKYCLKSFSPSVSKIPRYWGSLWWVRVPIPMLQRCSEAFLRQDSQTKHRLGSLNYQVWPYQIPLPTHCLLNTARDEQVKRFWFFFFSG